VDWPVLSRGEGGQWIGTLSDLLGWALLSALLLLALSITASPPTTLRRRFWCPASRREVEVEFEERGWLWLRRAVAVRTCSVFDPPTAVGCRRRCLEPAFRQLHAPPSPLGLGGAAS
jgi:hypothetical protein